MIYLVFPNYFMCLRLVHQIKMTTLLRRGTKTHLYFSFYYKYHGAKHKAGINLLIQLLPTEPLLGSVLRAGDKEGNRRWSLSIQGVPGTVRQPRKPFTV